MWTGKIWCYSVGNRFVCCQLDARWCKYVDVLFVYLIFYNTFYRLKYARSCACIDVAMALVTAAAAAATAKMMTTKSTTIATALVKA